MIEMKYILRTIKHDGLFPVSQDHESLVSQY